YTLMFLGMAPIGSLQAGAIANALSPSAAMRIGSVICALTAVLLSPMFLNAGERVGGKAS
ncbi:MAG TPA: MFS transporter, partial [Armatimonadetes bacterium]|nr:MFS transporter [Armatimonadota bacterium]